MSSLTALLGTMSSSLMAQTGALQVTGENVANVNTPGYVKRTADLENLPGGTGGVQMAGVVRSVNTFAAGQVLSEQGLQSAAGSRSDSLGSAQAILAPTTGGIGSDINSFFSSMSALSASPSDPSTRSAALASASTLAQDVSTTANGLATSRDSLLGQAQDGVTQLNQQLSQIAALNQQITTAQAQGDTAPDLRDQRDSLVSSVSQSIGAQVIQDPSGSETLLSSGTALVSGNQAASISVSVDSSNNLKFQVTRGDGSSGDITANVTQGSLGGIREARDVDIPQTQKQLDQFAYDFSNTVNAVHEQGFGLDGTGGRPLFAAPSQVAGAASAMAVDPSMVGNPQFLAAASSASDVPGGSDNAVAIGQIANQPFEGGTSPSAAFANVTAQLGSAKSSADAEKSLRDDTVAQAQQLEQSSDGVSLDEEMTNLTQFQQAYQASARVIQTVSTLLSGLMQEI